MLIINFVGREVKGLSKGRYDETFASEDDIFLFGIDLSQNLPVSSRPCGKGTGL